ncbi:MAG: TonB-dependent receptor plug domain-containing protein [Bacteroidales bacterium]|jgi:TonB-dependent SusC/RagA subfamily outer membrane receptor|nr:TonB-dependent receptor plug domain-containing protein [Bacteroidales bacterium]
MNTFLLYLLKANIILVLLYGFYALFLKRDTFYAHHRWYLLLTLLAIFFFPLINVASWFSGSETTVMVSGYVPSASEIYQILFSIYPEEITMVGETAAETHAAFSINWVTMLVIFLGSGAAYFACKRLIQFLRIMGLVHRSRKQSRGNQTVVIMDHSSSPFSFFNWIFLPSDRYSEEELDEIFEHERIHCRNWHSADILLSELVTCLCWYNPVAWMMRNDLRQNIEYYTDSRILKKGFDRKHYQYHLLKVTGNGHYSIANHFYFNHLKNRIMKMNKKSSPRVLYAKYLLAFPLLMAAMLLVRASGIEENITSVSETGHLALSDEQIILPENEPDPMIATIVQDKDAVTEQPVINQSLRLTPIAIGTPDGYTVTSDTLPEGFWIRGISSSPLIIINGKETSTETFSKLSPDNIHSFSILKNASATTLYGEKGKNGVVLIVTKDAPDEMKKDKKEDKPEESRTYKVPPDVSSTKFFIRGITSFEGNNALIILDGKESTAERITELSQDKILSFSILKDSTATALYGEKGKSGVIIITTKDAPDEIEKETSTKKGTYMKMEVESEKTRKPIGVIQDYRIRQGLSRNPNISPPAKPEDITEKSDIITRMSVGFEDDAYYVMIKGFVLAYHPGDQLSVYVDGKKVEAVEQLSASNTNRVIVLNDQPAKMSRKTSKTKTGTSYTYMLEHIAN